MFKDKLKSLINPEEGSKNNKKKIENLIFFVIILIITIVVINIIWNAVNAECKDENYKQGIELVEKQFKEFLAKNKVEEIPALGETFDPGLHEAVSSVQDDTKGVQEIVQEYRKGYKIGDKVIRHSMVVVAN